MNFQEYSSYFKQVLKKDPSLRVPPYDNPEYFHYTRLNWSRMNRWFKTGQLAPEMLEVVEDINKPQRWIVITEPWCGDAAHNIPFIEMLSWENPLINVSYELRDSSPFRIKQYLTNGTESIPRLIIQDNAGKDLLVWGPRPRECQRLYTILKKGQAPFSQVKVEIQNWYNANKGLDLQNELTTLFLQKF